MALSAPSNLSLDINISGDAPRVAQSTAEQLQKAEQNAKRLNDRLKEQVAYMRELKTFTANRQDAFGTKTTDEQLAKQKQAIANLRADQQARVDLTKAARDENAENLKRLKLLQQHEGQLKNNIASTNMLGQAWSKFSMIFTRVLDALIAFKIIQWISQLIELFTTHVIEVSETFEKLRVRLYTLNPNLQQTAKIWEEIKSVTITSPFKIAEVGQAAVMLRTFGVSAVDNLRVVSDWASAVEKDLNDVSVAFGKIVNRSPRTNLMLSTRGLSEGGYEKYLDEYKDRATALRKYIDDTFGGTAARVSETFYGLKTNISDLFDIMQEKAGRPIFDKLKQDLNYIQAILKDINVGSGGETAGFFAQLIPDSVLRLLASNRLYGEQQNLRLQSVDGSSLSAKERLAITERLISLNKMLNQDQSILVKLWDGLSQVAHGHVFDMTDLSDIYEKQRKELEDQLPARREAVRLANEELLKRNSNFSVTSAYELQKSMEKAPELTKFLNSIVITGGDVISQSAMYMMTSLTDTISKKRALAKIEADITATVNRRPKEDEDKVRFGLEREADFKGLILEWLKLNVEKKTRELKDLLSVVRELGSTFAGQKAQLSELLGGDSNIDARIAKNIAYLTFEKVNLQDRMSYIDASIVAQDKLSKMTNEQLNSKSNQKAVKQLQHRVEVGKAIIQLTTDENNELLKQKNLIAEIGNLQRDIIKTAAQQQMSEQGYLYQQGGISADKYRQLLLNSAYGLGGEENKLTNQINQAYSDMWGFIDNNQITQSLESEKTAVKLTKERQQLNAEILRLQKEILTLPSESFGEALNKQLLQAKKTLDSIYDTLAIAFLDMGREFSKGIITEALFGTRGKELTGQIDDLRFQLIQMQIEKDNTLNTAQKVKLIEDQEVSLLARINDLERQRSQIILTLLTDVSKKMLDKLEDQAINALFSLAGGLFNSAQPSGFTTNDYYSTHAPRWAGSKNMQTPLLPSSSPSSRNVVVQFTGNVYGGREFKDQVQTAIVEINRNIR